MSREQEEGVEVTAGGGSTALSREQKEGAERGSRGHCRGNTASSREQEEGVEVTAGGRREHSFE